MIDLTRSQATPTGMDVESPEAAAVGSDPPSMLFGGRLPPTPGFVAFHASARLAMAGLPAPGSSGDLRDAPAGLNGEDSVMAIEGDEPERPEGLRTNDPHKAAT